MQRNARFRSLLALVAIAVGVPVAGWAEEAWWSRRPLERPPVPDVEGAPAGTVRTEIDRFIIHRHREQGLRMSPEADRRTLIRRLYFNLVGLPPAPAEVEAFVADPDPAAYEKLVDRLLGSPQYGERWARHWLDVVHFGETHGYDKDKPRPNAWPYRDYVIRAFNEDKPYARFVQEQLAGDILWPDTPDGIAATGFIAAGPWDFIGHAEVPEEKIDGKVARHLDRDDMVTTTMNAFCSITVQCAQCHDHKLDPVTMEDYYSLQSVFAALDRADREYDPDGETARARAFLRGRIKDAEQRLESLGRRLVEMRTDELKELDERISRMEGALAASASIEGKPRSDRYGYHSQVAQGQDVVKWVQVDLGREHSLETVALFAADEYGFADFGFPHRFRVEASTSPGFEEPLLLESNEETDFPRPGAAPVVIDGKGVRARYVRVTASKLWSRRRAGQPLSNDWIFALGELVVRSEGQSVPVVAVTALDSIEALPRWGREDLIDGILGRYPLADRAPQGLAALLQSDANVQRRELEALLAEREVLLEEVAGEVVKELRRVREVRDSLQGELGALPKPALVYAGTIHTGSGAFKGRGHVGGRPREIFVLDRGSVTQPGRPVQPAAIPGIVPGRSARFELQADHPEGARRVALAEWITHSDNTLTWRSIVNRVWHYHFGRGLVDTPNDFGLAGGQPSHPELLDWLAVAFRDGGGSLKDLHRLILTSAVYRQQSAHDEACAAIDGSNRFLWRQNRRRLEAEAVRDTVLLVSGKLDPTMGGPSFRDFVIERPEHSPHYQYHKADPDDPATHRRSIYRFIVRSQPQPFMDTMDCADPSQLVDKRGETTTALQALALLNNAFVVRMAEHFARQVESEPDPVAAAIAHALSRPASEEERRLLNQYARKHGLAATCRLIFNLNEFAFVD